MIKLLKNKTIFFLVLSRFLSTFGDVFFDIFITWKIFEKSHDVKDVALLLGSSFILKALFSNIVGLISDKFERKYILVGCDIFSAVILIPFIYLYNKSGDTIAVYLSLFLFKNFFSTLFSNAFVSFVADSVKIDEVVTTESLISTTVRIVTFAGGAVAGFLVSHFSMYDAAIFDAMTFLLSALALSKITNKKTQSQSVKADNNKIKFSVKAGLIFFYENILQKNSILIFCLFIFLLNLVYGYIPSVFPYLLADKLKLGPAYLGFLRSLITVGEIAGLLIVGKIGNRVSFCFSLGLAGTAISLLLVLSPIFSIVVIFLSYVLYGFFDAITQPYYSYTIATIDSNVRGRVLGFIDMVVLVAAPAGMALGTFFVKINFNLAVIFFSTILLAVFVMFNLSKLTKNISIGEIASE